MIEEWCKITCIKRLRNYEISSFGNVRHCKTHQQLAQSIDANGYTLGRGKLKQGCKQV